MTVVTWTVDSAFGAPGTYAFRPVLPKKYERYTITAALPQVQVTLLPPSGDVNGDENLDIRDISRMAASAGRTDRPLCDLDGSGMTTWNDFRLLVSALGTRALTATGVTDAPPMMVQFDKTSYTAGEIATACISAGGTGFDAFTIALDYDSAALDLSSVTLADSLLETARETGGGTPAPGRRVPGGHGLWRYSYRQLPGAAGLRRTGGYAGPGLRAALQRRLCGRILRPADPGAYPQPHRSSFCTARRPGRQRRSGYGRRHPSGGVLQ